MPAPDPLQSVRRNAPPTEGSKVPDRAISRIRTWWRRASLIQRLVLVALLPSAVSTVLLAILLTRHQVQSMRSMIRATAAAYVAQAASVASDPMRESDQVELQQLALSIGNLPHVSRVTIRDADGSVVAQAHNPKLYNGKPVSLRQDIIDPHANGSVLGSLQIDIDSETSLLAQHTNIFDTLLWLSVAILLAIVLSWQQARWISAPLRRLSLAMRGLGNTDRPISVEVTDESEIGELQRGFNTAAAALHELHRGMEQRIEEATQELERKNAALEQASKAKARFLAGATHDLRQPLYALTLFSSALADKETDPERIDRINHVQQCIESLDRLFGELLDLSRLEAGAMQPELRDFALDEVFQEVSRNFRIQAESQHLRLVTRPTRLWVHSDRTMLARILNNLVSNALRYTTEGGVLVGARSRGDHVRIDVLDTGVGIPEEHQAHIFEEFYRIEDPQHKKHEVARGTGQRGLGLGLSTVKRLSELLDAGCRLISSPGRGSQFTLMVPASRVPLPEHVHTPPSRPTATPAPGDLQDVHVLVIDDDQAILAGMHDLLRKWGCRVRMATDCESAMQRVAEDNRPPDIVISDLHLGSDCDGVEILARLAAHFGCGPDDMPPFARLLITGETERRRLQPALTSNLPILFKPVPAEPLRETVVALLKAHREQVSEA